MQQSFNAAIISVLGISVSLVEWKDDKGLTLMCMKARRWQWLALIRMKLGHVDEFA